MKHHILQIFLVLSFAVLLFSCQKDITPLPDPILSYLKFASATSANSSFNLELSAKDSLFVGYNNVFFKVTNKTDGKAITLATIALHPLMDMVTFKHACPNVNPSTNANSDGFFQGVIVFSMPGTNGSWTVDVDITADGQTETAHLVIDKVNATTPVRKMVVIDTLKTSVPFIITKYPISLIIPKIWKVGINPFEITIHKMESMMSFPAVTDLTVEITPEMPSMGHGSPNNVNPVHVSNGHYAGNVNFTMTGDWRIHLTIKKDGWLISDKAYFDILF